MIETERLLLRKFQHEDFDAMFIILSDPETMQHYGCKSVYETGKQGFIAVLFKHEEIIQQPNLYSLIYILVNPNVGSIEKEDYNGLSIKRYYN